ncbi:MAG: hypothetical protein QM677_04985 [Microbacterium sp.]
MDTNTAPTEILSDSAPTEIDTLEPRETGEPSPTAKTRKPLPKWAIPGAVGALIGIGLASGALIPQITSLQASYDEQQVAISDLQEKYDKVDAKYTAEHRQRVILEASNEQLATKQETWEANLQAREDAVAARESAVQETEDQIAASSFGSGIRLVGTNTAAGTYTTEEITSGMCYYVWKTSTASDADIIDNNIVESGTATVTLQDGDIFESSGCGTWTKVG